MISRGSRVQYTEQGLNNFQRYLKCLLKINFGVRNRRRVLKKLKISVLTETQNKARFYCSFLERSHLLYIAKYLYIHVVKCFGLCWCMGNGINHLRECWGTILWCVVIPNPAPETIKRVEWQWPTSLNMSWMNNYILAYW